MTIRISEKSLLKVQQSINWKYNFKLLMDSAENYARKWIQREKEVDTLSEWVKAVRSLIQNRIRKLKRLMDTKATYVFKDPDVAETLSTTIYSRHICFSSCRQTPNNIILMCKKHYIDCLKIGVGVDISQCIPTYTTTTLSTGFR